MPDSEFAEGGVGRSRTVLIVASAVSVVLLVTAAIIGVRSWRDAAARGPAADGATPVTPSGSPAASMPDLPGSPSPFSSDLIASSAPVSSPPAQPSTAAPVSRSKSPAAAGRVRDNQPNLKVSIEVSPTHVVMGQRARVTVTIGDAGGVFERPVTMVFGGSDPSDNFGDAKAPCSDSTGWINCPITDVRPGHQSSFTFSFIPGPFPGMDGFDDRVFAWFEYTDRYGRPQQTDQYFADVLLYDAPASTPPASEAPGTPPSPSTSPPVTPTASPASTG
jgi:hypothetical protein